MAIDKGNIKTSANYDVKAQKPLDGRAVRPAKADLIKKESWSSDGSTVYVYEGMQVYVEDEKKTYYLKDITKMFASDFSGWELMGTGAGSGITEEKEVYIGSEEPPVGAKVWIDPTGTPSQPSTPSAGVEVIDNLESESTTAALSANQGRVLKEMIEELPSAGTQDKPVIFYYPLEIQGEIREITEEQKAINAEGYAKVVNALINGMMPNIIMPLSEFQAGELMGISGGYGGVIPTQVLYIAPNTPLSEVWGTGLIVYITGDLYHEIIISEDGSAMAQ